MQPGRSRAFAARGAATTTQDMQSDLLLAATHVDATRKVTAMFAMSDDEHHLGSGLDACVLHFEEHMQQGRVRAMAARCTAIMKTYLLLGPSAERHTTKVRHNEELSLEHVAANV